VPLMKESTYDAAALHYWGLSRGVLLGVLPLEPPRLSFPYVPQP
jgi:hypothetical protein